MEARMIRLDDVIEELQRHHPDADIGLVRKAYVFSAQAHRGQTRINGEEVSIRTSGGLSRLHKNQYRLLYHLRSSA